MHHVIIDLASIGIIKYQRKLSAKCSETLYIIELYNGFATIATDSVCTF